MDFKVGQLFLTLNNRDFYCNCVIRILGIYEDRITYTYLQSMFCPILCTKKRHECFGLCLITTELERIIYGVDE